MLVWCVYCIVCWYGVCTVQYVGMVCVLYSMLVWCVYTVQYVGMVCVLYSILVWCVYCTVCWYGVCTVQQSSPQDFIKALGSSHSEVFIRYFSCERSVLSGVFKGTDICCFRPYIVPCNGI